MCFNNCSYFIDNLETGEGRCSLPLTQPCLEEEEFVSSCCKDRVEEVELPIEKGSQAHCLGCGSLCKLIENT